MATQCTYADDAFLVQAYPGVVVLFNQQWQLTFVNAQTGDYTVTINGISYTYSATTPPDDVTVIRDGVRAAITTPLVATNIFGADRLDLAEVEAGTITDFSATAPDPADISLVQTVAADNIAAREFWLAQARCLLNCCLIPPCHQELYHASMAAHLLMTSANTDSNGFAASDFEEWRLGPATLRKGAAANDPSDGELGTTVPGRRVLELRRLYIPAVACSPCGVLCA